MRAMVPFLMKCGDQPDLFVFNGGHSLVCDAGKLTHRTHFSNCAQAACRFLPGVKDCFDDLIPPTN